MEGVVQLEAICLGCGLVNCRARKSQDPVLVVPGGAGQVWKGPTLQREPGTESMTAE